MLFVVLTMIKSLTMIVVNFYVKWFLVVLLTGVTPEQIEAKKFHIRIILVTFGASGV